MMPVLRANVPGNYHNLSQSQSSLFSDCNQLVVEYSYVAIFRAEATSALAGFLCPG